MTSHLLGDVTHCSAGNFLLCVPDAYSWFSYSIFQCSDKTSDLKRGKTFEAEDEDSFSESIDKVLSLIHI